MKKRMRDEYYGYGGSPNRVRQRSVLTCLALALAARRCPGPAVLAA